jgi:hypothetical protein
MALPGGLYVGQPINYLPNIFDANAWTGGDQVPTAAIVTKIDTVNNLVSLVAFTEDQGPLFRKDIPYYSDAAADQNGFKLTTDVLTCTTEDTGVAASNTAYNYFVIDYTAPAGSHGVLAFYRVNGSGTWLTPNQPGNATATADGSSVIFDGLTDGVTYDFLIQNICNNGVPSAGVSITETATAPL